MAIPQEPLQWQQGIARDPISGNLESAQNRPPQQAETDQEQPQENEQLTTQQRENDQTEQENELLNEQQQQMAASQMEADRTQRAAQAKKTAEEDKEKQQEKAMEPAAQLAMANPITRIIVYVYKSIKSVFGTSAADFFIVTSIIGFFLSIPLIWLPIFGNLIALFFAMIFAIPLQPIILPKIKPLVEAASKKATIIPKKT